MRPATASRLIASLSAVIDDPRVLERIAAVPREQFVPPALRARAYENVALPIDCGQTISQPLVVGRMLALLELS
jgi:protein-L-isoaspartate(D-aspartate) O-methyltransferase